VSIVTLVVLCTASSALANPPTELPDSTTVTQEEPANAPPLAAFGWSPNVPQIGQTVTFDASASSDAEGSLSGYLWDFGEGPGASGVTVQHTFPTSGTRTVTLTVTDSDGKTTSVQHAVRVNAVPAALFTFAALDRAPGQPFNVPLLGQRVAFSGTKSSDSDGTIAAYAWDFNGDGSFTDDNQPSLITTLTTPGVVTIGLRVTDSDGATQVYTQPVRVDQVPASSFTFTPTSPLAGQRASFESTSSDPDGPQDITSLAWDLDGEGTYGDATGPTATRVFGTAGTYPVALQVIDSVGVQAVELQHVTVRIPGSPPVAGSPFKSTFVSTPLTPIGSNAASKMSVPGRRTKVGIVAGVRVSIAGRVFEGATRITRLLVSAPSGAVVTARCTGHRCPAKHERHRARAHRRVRLHTLERMLDAGTRVVVTVTKRGVVGKQIQFTIRRMQPPIRRELCLVPGAKRAARCPAS
jgi:PKD repeat protein